MHLALNHIQRQGNLAFVILSRTSRSFLKMGMAEELLSEGIPAEVVEAVRCLTKDEISFPSILPERKI